MSEKNLYQRLGGENVVNSLVEDVYDRMLNDYRVSRFFNDTEKDKQIEALEAVVAVIFGEPSNGNDFKSLVSQFFMTAFARFKDKELLPETGFAYFGYIIGQDNPSSKYLCDSHSHLLKFMPEDLHYDTLIEHLTTSLARANLDNALVTEVLALVESGRNSVLGK